jgi:hypothetical protein
MGEIGANLVNGPGTLAAGFIQLCQARGPWAERRIGRTATPAYSPGIGLMMLVAWVVGMTLMNRVEPVEGLD